jgi:hypothetical protein
MRNINLKRAVEFEKYVQNIEEIEGEGALDGQIEDMEEEFLDLAEIDEEFARYESSDSEDDILLNVYYDYSKVGKLAKREKSDRKTILKPKTVLNQDSDSDHSYEEYEEDGESEEVDLTEKVPEEPEPK